MGGGGGLGRFAQSLPIQCAASGKRRRFFWWGVVVQVRGVVGGAVTTCVWGLRRSVVWSRSVREHS
jgi:hypothetical protein